MAASAHVGAQAIVAFDIGLRLSAQVQRLGGVDGWAVGLTVDQAVQAAAALMPGLKNMVNGVLRNALRQRDQWSAWEQSDLEARYGLDETKSYKYNK